MKHQVTEISTVLDVLSKIAPESAKRTHRIWLKEGRVHVDDRVVKIGKQTVSPGEVVEVRPKKVLLRKGIELLFADTSIIVIHKPAGLLSVATDREVETSAHAILKEEFRPKRVYPVHRLDRETSGVMVFALGTPSREALNVCFKDHTIERAYTAVVEGTMEKKSGTWTSYLYEDANFTVHKTNQSEKGRLAITHYRVLGTHRNRTLLELRLETGRKHQIRVHCASAGHPVVGDPKYGEPARRLYLHAHLLAFPHPKTEQIKRFQVGVPAEFTRLVRGEKNDAVE